MKKEFILTEQEINDLCDENDAALRTSAESEAKSPCPYCVRTTSHNDDLIDKDGVLAYTDRGHVRIEAFAWDGSAVDVSFEIAYCPKCGRKLGMETGEGY